MQTILSVELMRESDEKTIAAGTPGRVLMRRAGEGVFAAVRERMGWKAPVGIVCGTGNNAGDGYVIALLLKEAGIPCTLVLAADRFSPDGRYYFDQCVEAGIPVIRPGKDAPAGEGEADAACPDPGQFATLVDCLLGTGFAGEPRGPVKDLIEQINKAGEAGAAVISVDINSGLGGNSGTAVLCVKSDLTVSIGCFQPGHFLNMAMDVMKEKCSCEIGIAPAAPGFSLIGEEDVPVLFPVRAHESNKGSFGYTALIGGSLRYSGAARLAAMAGAAVRSGAGVVKLAVPRGICQAILPQVLESTLFPLSEGGDGFFAFREEEFKELLRGVRTAAFGMGIGLTPETKAALRWLLENYTGVLIVDADGLNALAAILQEEEEGAAFLNRAACRLVLTPHLKEFSRLSGLSVPEIREAPIDSARAFAARTGAVVLLKGPATVCTDGERVILCDRGCPGMATGGSGDVLSGILAAVSASPALAADGKKAQDLVFAAAAAAWINGAAGELAQSESADVCMSAGDTARCVKQVMTRILRDPARR